jgi:hypothetical protein
METLAHHLLQLAAHRMVVFLLQSVEVIGCLLLQPVYHHRLVLFSYY